LSKILKAKCWKLFSKYIRMRDANSKGICTCCTCGKKDEWKRMQAGHFLAGRGLAILFDERGVHSQCSGCNIFKGGNPIEYFLFMEKKHGRKVIDDLLRLKNTTRRISDDEYMEMIDDIHDKLVGLDMRGMNDTSHL